MSQLTKQRVLLTRAVDDLPAMTDAVKAAGGEPVCLPLLGFEPGADVSRLQADIASLSPLDWIALTSRRAAPALAKAYGNQGASLAVVGSATARSLRTLGIEPALEGGGRSGALGLAKLLIRQHPKPQTVLWCTNNLAADDFAHALQQAGIRVERRETYRTKVLTPSEAECQAALLPAPKAVILASPSAVRAFNNTLPKEFGSSSLAGLRVVVPGPSTAVAARNHGWQQVIEAASPSPRDLAEAALA